MVRPRGPGNIARRHARADIAHYWTRCLVRVRKHEAEGQVLSGLAKHWVSYVHCLHGHAFLLLSHDFVFCNVFWQVIRLGIPHGIPSTKVCSNRWLPHTPSLHLKCSNHGIKVRDSVTSLPLLAHSLGTPYHAKLLNLPFHHTGSFSFAIIGFDKVDFLSMSFIPKMTCITGIVGHREDK